MPTTINQDLDKLVDDLKYMADILLDTIDDIKTENNVELDHPQNVAIQKARNIYRDYFGG